MMNASFPDRRRGHRTEPGPSEPHGFVADINAPLEQEILDLSQRKRITDVHHHREADHLGRPVEIAKRVTHRRRLRNAPPRLKPIYSDNAFTATMTTTDSGRSMYSAPGLTVIFSDIRSEKGLGY